MSGTPFSNVNNIHVHSMIPEGKGKPSGSIASLRTRKI